MNKVTLEDIEHASSLAEQHVREIDEQIDELKARKRAAAEQVNVLAQQREIILRTDPRRRRMVIGSGR